MKDFAVVFDCAGTLLEKYRVAKDLDQPFYSPPASPNSNYSLEDLDGTDVGVINT